MNRTKTTTMITTIAKQLEKHHPADTAQTDTETEIEKKSLISLQPSRVNLTYSFMRASRKKTSRFSFSCYFGCHS